MLYMSALNAAAACARNIQQDGLVRCSLERVFGVGSMSARAAYVCGGSACGGGGGVTESGHLCEMKKGTVNKLVNSGQFSFARNN